VSGLVLLLTEPGGSDNSGKRKQFYQKMENIPITGQNVDLNAGFSVFIVFARIGDDKNITGFIVENDPSNGINDE
jgi:alkylation response protein AidB-like acyl-CoA dehydrogenase